MVGAKNAGLITCFAKYGHSVGNISKANPDHTIHRIEEILEIVSQVYFIGIHILNSEPIINNVTSEATNAGINAAGIEIQGGNPQIFNTLATASGAGQRATGILNGSSIVLFDIFADAEGGLVNSGIASGGGFVTMKNVFARVIKRLSNQYTHL